jgi:hypothetical protein
MTFRSAMIGAVLTPIIAATAQAEIRIYQDAGGHIEYYLDMFARVRDSGEKIVIDGTCKSACTLVLGAVPRDRICVTPRAKLGFHAAYVFDSWGRAVMSPEDTGVLWANYPQPIRNWLTQHGGLTVKMIYLSGRELRSIYPPCGVPAGTGERVVHAEIHPARAETKSINATPEEGAAPDE